MAYLDPSEAFEHLKSRVLEGVQSSFPEGKIAGKTQTLFLDRVEVKDPPSPDDIRAQHDAKVSGATWSVPVYGHFRLQDNASGKVVDQRKVRLLELPVPTRRHSYIVKGQEWQVDNQWQLKPGAYAQRDRSGGITTQFNVVGRRSFHLDFNPETKVFSMSKYGKSKAELPIYPMLKTMGVPDSDLEKAWGKEIFDANKAVRGADKVLEKFYGLSARKGPTTPTQQELAQHLYDTMLASKMDPKATALTLGKPLESVTGEALRLSTEKLLKIQAGHPEDDRDSLVFKNLRSAGDYAFDRIEHVSKHVRDKMIRKVNGAKDIHDVVQFPFGKTVLGVFGNDNDAARNASQINPIEMVSSAMQTTIMGEGAIQNARIVSDKQKLVNPSHLGFLDPINTPEGAKTGVTLRLPIGVKKVGMEAHVRLFNIKTGKPEDVSAQQFSTMNVVLPDQVKWEHGKPVPLGKTVKASTSDNQIREVPFHEAQYVMRYPAQVFNMTSNLIPFLGNTNGNRASMASRQMEQAISLKHRQNPLVQVSLGTEGSGTDTFEKLLGKHASHATPIDGTVASVHADGIVIRGSGGEKHTVQLYNNFPLNDPKSVMHSTPIVAVGDKVHKGQTIADTNFSKGGVLALGTNLRVGYLPYKGYNFEDGIVISKSAAEKLSSEHLTKPDLKIDPQMIFDKSVFLAKRPGQFSKAQLDKLDDKGIIRVGQKVREGDPLIAVTKPYLIKDRVGMKAIRRSMSGAHDDKSLSWDSHFEGTVAAVHQTPEGIRLHIKTTEPMQVGDKMAGRYGNKGICFDPETQVLTERGWLHFTEVAPGDRVCTLDAATGKIAYQVPTRQIELDYEGPMYRFEGRRLDLMTTPDHKHFVRTAREKEFRLESAKDCFGHQRVHLRTGTWVGEEIDQVTIPGRVRREGSREHYEFCEPRAYDADDFLEFFGYWVTEGSLDATSHITIGQRKEKNPETYEAIRQVLVRLGYEPCCGPDVLAISDPRLRAWLSQFGTSPQKFIPRMFLVLPPRQLRILADALFAGDGGVYFREKDNHTRYELFTSSPQLADDYQEIALKLGMSANIRPQHRADRNVEYVVRWSLKEEVYTTKDGRYSSRAERWVDYCGKVYCVEVPNHVIYVRRNGIPVWSGNCTMILEDHEMPHTKDGKHIEVALNPSGIPGRMNVGQVLEVAAAKIAEKTGKPYIVKNFEAEVDNLGRIQGELKQHGLSDTEELFDPITKQSLGKTMVGPQHMFKLVHQIEKKLSVRSGMGNEGYDSNLQPSKGGHTGGQNIGTLGLYAMLAHGATANIREMQSYKSQGEDPQTDPKKKFHSDHNFIWSMLQTGQPLPTPKPTFAFEKFRGYLKAAGVNMEKQGHDLVLAPMTDAQIRALAPHALTNAADILNVKVDKNTGDFKPRPGSLFDERATGGLGGTRWSRIELAEPLPNPMFEGPIRHLTGLTESDFESIVHGERGVNPAGKLTTPDAGVTGGGGIKILLDRVNTKKELELAQAALTTAPRAKVDGALKKVKYLRALDKLGITASDAYMLHNLPVLPPSLRPAQRLPAGNALQIEDMNRLYANFAALNDKLGNPILKRSLADADKAALRKDYYSKAGEGLRSVMGVGGTYESAGKNKGLLHYIAGKDPKTGFFQSRLVNRRQDLTMRSTIIPEPAMGLDQVGLPREAALKLFRPFVVRKLKEMGSIRNQMEAADYIDKKGPDVWKALDRVMVDHPVLLKRDPALHKFSVQAFMPKAVAGEAIQIHPLTVTGFNADFDGDTMSVYVPITHEAKAEARNMLPSKNLFSEATGKIVFQPTLESALGLYKLSLVGKETGKAYKHPGEVLEAVRKGSADVTDVVQLNGKKTTAGRILLSSALPEDEHGKEPLQSNMLHKLDTRINDKGLTKLMTTLAKEHSGIYGEHVNRLKDLGNGASFGVIALPSTKSPFVLGKAEGTNAAVADKTYLAIGTHTLSLEDFVADKKNRDPILKKTHAEVEKIYANKKIPMGERDRQAVELYVKAGDEIQKKHEAGMEKDPSNLFTMYRAGVKPNWTAYKQMVIAPMIVKDSSNRDVPTPVTKSYSEGLDIGGYWTQMHGARRGAVMKVQEVEKPGYTSKLLLNNLMSTVVDQHNCGTGHGVALDVTENDVHDRYLAQEFKHGPMQVPAGELLTTDLVSKIRSAKPNATIVVRSPLKCESDKGVCQTCAGLDASGKKHDLGTNIGIQAGHAIGERIVQLILKEFHTGGVKQSGREGRSLGFTRFQQLVNLPKSIPDQSTLAKTSGTITRVQPTATGVDVFIGNKPHHVGKDTSGMPLHTRLPNEHLMGGYIPWHPPVAGMHVEAGTELSDPNRTLWNARSYYGITHSMEKTQGRLTDEIYDLYKSSGVRRRSVETLVRTMGNLTKVDDPGDHPEILRGEYRPLTQVNNLNHALMKEGKKPIEHSPVLEGITSLPHDMHDDWIAEMQHDNLRTTMMDAAATGRPSHIHGPHPIPGVVFGAEFGLTSKDSKKPGLAHLSTVPEHHY